MRKFFYLKLLVLLLAITGFSNVALSQRGFKTNSSDSITIQVERALNGSIFMHYYDEFGQNQSLSLEKNSKILKQQIKLQSSTPFVVYNSNTQVTPLLLYPGETVTIQSDGIFWRIKGSNDTIRNNELLFFDKLTRKYGMIDASNDVTIIQSIAKKNYSFDQIVTLIDSVKNNQINFLNDYRSRYFMSEFFFNFCNNYINYMGLKCKISYARLAKDFFAPATLRQFYSYKPLLTNDSLISYKFYRNCVAVYNQNVATLLTQNDSVLNRYALADTFFTGKTRDFLLFHLVQQVMKIPSPAASAIIEAFPKKCLEQKYVSFIEDVNHLKSVAGNQLYELLTFSKQSITFKNLLQRKKDSVLLIDYWASWCGPCIAELPNTQFLKELYSNKPVQFLFISLDGSAKAWEGGYKKYPSLMTAQNSFLLPKSFDSELALKFNIKTIPRYILVDKKGSVVSLDAPKPSEPQLKKLIDKYLNE